MLIEQIFQANAESGGIQHTCATEANEPRVWDGHHSQDYLPLMVLPCLSQLSVHKGIYIYIYILSD